MTMDALDIANLVIVLSGLIISVLGLILAVCFRQSSQGARGFFPLLFLLLVGYTASATICHLASTATLQKFALFSNSLFSSLLIPAITWHLLRCARRSWRHSPLLALIVALWAVYFLLLIVAQFTTWIYYYTPNGVYHRGPWYPLLLVPPVLMMGIDIVGLRRLGVDLTHRQRVSFLVLFVVPLVCMLLQMLTYGLLLIVFGTSAAALFMFVYLLTDQVERSLRQQRQIAEQRAKIMVLQMRPHFIYNTLMTIYSLCNLDPQKARRVTMDFTDYLRRNFDAVAAESAVPFSTELEHTRAYLAVEQARHEEMLLVEYDTRFTRFRLPPLTLQPIAENAVKHALDPHAGPLRVTIRTYHVGRASVVVVEDNGPGFVLAEKKGQHATLTNIQQRLDMMCGGRLEIRPRDSGGTVVTVTIPDRT